MDVQKVDLSSLDRGQLLRVAQALRVHCDAQDREIQRLIRKLERLSREHPPGNPNFQLPLEDRPTTPDLSDPLDDVDSEDEDPDTTESEQEEPSDGQPNPTLEGPRPESVADPDRSESAHPQTAGSRGRRHR
jgi:hypothetical protein